MGKHAFLLGKINTDCAVCIRVCPFTRDYTRFWNRAWLRLAGSRLRKFALRLDHKSTRGNGKDAFVVVPKSKTKRVVSEQAEYSQSLFR